jgi:hypothetical protein
MGAARGLRLPGRPRPVRPATAWHTSERSPLFGRASRRGWRRCHSDGGGANGGGRAPTAVRLPTGLGEGETSSPELLVDGEKTGSAAAFFRRGGATVAGGGPATLTVDESRDGGDGRTATSFRHGRRPGFGQQRRRGRDGARRGGSDSQSERRGAVGTPARGPDSAFNARVRRGTWQPRGNGALPGRPGADSGV